MKKGFEFLCKTFGSKTKAQEIILLLSGAKEVVRQGFYEEEIPEVEKFCRDNFLFLVKSKFKVLLTDDNFYTNEGLRIDEKDQRRGLFFVYLSKSEEPALIASYYELVGDDFNLGLILGYPPCCVEFFCRNFGSGKADLELTPKNIWTNLSKRKEDCVLLSHFPCDSDCKLSIALGKKYFEVLKNYDKERGEEIKEKLRMKRNEAHN